MSWLNNLKVAPKLFLGLGLILALAFLLGVLALQQMQLLHASEQRIITLARLQSDLKEIRIDENIPTDSPAQNLREAKIRVKWADIRKLLENKDQSGLSSLNSLLADYHSDPSKKMNDKNYQEVMMQIDALLDGRPPSDTGLAGESQALYDQAQASVRTLLAMTLTSGIAVALLLAPMLVRPLEETRKRLDSLTKSLAGNNPTVSIPSGPGLPEVRGQDEFGQLATSLDRALNQIQSTFNGLSARQRPAPPATDPFPSSPRADSLQTQKVHELAVRVNTSAQRLTGREQAREDDSAEDLVSLLSKTANLLESCPATTKNGAKTAPILRDEGDLPSHIMEMIKLLDWLALAKESAPQSGETGTPPGVLKHLRREIGRILSRAGVVTVEDAGLFNPNRQMVIDTVPNPDPALSDTISSTVRPGYLFREDLLRPQEVILFTVLQR